MTNEAHLLTLIRDLLKVLNTTTASADPGTPSLLAMLTSIDQRLETLEQIEPDYRRFNEENFGWLNTQYSYTTFNGDVVVDTKSVFNGSLDTTMVYQYTYDVVAGETVLTQISLVI